MSGYIAAEDLEAGFLHFKKRGADITAVIVRSNPVHLKTWSKKPVRIKLTVQVLNKGAAYGRKKSKR